jgi:hypothetical protein
VQRLCSDQRGNSLNRLAGVPEREQEKMRLASLHPTQDVLPPIACCSAQFSVHLGPQHIHDDTVSPKQFVKGLDVMGAAHEQNRLRVQLNYALQPAAPSNLTRT